MPLYRWDDDQLEPVPSATFEAERLQEADLQRLLRDQPGVLEEGLFIIAEEYSNWMDSSRSIDLLGMDESGRLVVIELKRTQSGDHSELQAIRYAAMVSNMTLEDVVDAHSRYLAKRGIDEDARTQVLTHLGAAEESDAVISTEHPRIILASAGFSKELTTSVLWLNDSGLNITCLRLRLYRNGDGILLDADQVIPLPEAADYMVRAKAREHEIERRRSSTSDAVRVPGSEDFYQSMETAPAESKSTLDLLYRWALALEEGGLAALTSSRYSWGFSLLVRPPRDRTSNSGLVVIFHDNLGPGLYFWRSVFERRAPNSVEPIESIIAPVPLGQGNSVREISRELLDALNDAYREANRLPTTPLPGTVPGSPATADR